VKECCGEVVSRSVVEKFRGEVLWRSAVEKCCKCCEGVLWKSVIEK